MTISCPDGERKRLWRVFFYLLLVAAGCLLLCSKSSPLYPINDWSDANIYFTMGKGMAAGRVIYRDLYDHKGPLLYGLHALCALVSPLSFFGVYLLEVLSFALFLLSIDRMLALYGVRRVSFALLPILAMVILTSVSFQQGDSAEELCLPLLSWSLYGLLKYLKTEAPKPMAWKALVFHGVLCASVLWMKFTMLGFHFAWLFLVFLIQARQGQWKAALKSVGWFAVGITLSTLPWVFYFGLNGAMVDWLKTYLYDNLFLYSGSETAGVIGQGKAMAKAGWDWLMRNPGYTLPILMGLGWSAIRKDAAPWERLSLWLLLGFAALGVFFGGKTYLYYGFALAVFAGIALIPLGQPLEQVCEKLSSRKGLCGAIAALCCAGSLALCYGISPNSKESFLLPREETMQYQLAEAMAEQPGATLLNYGFMDAGFYTATGIVPTVKYFHQTNVPLQEMLDEQIRYIDEGVCDFVVTRGKQPESITEKYELVKTADSPGFWYEKVYLYRLKEPRE